MALAVGHPFEDKPPVVGVPTLWTPFQIATSAWYDAADPDTITDTGGDVDVWADKSGNGYDLVDTGEDDQPQTGTRTINGLNALDWVYTAATRVGSCVLYNITDAASIVPINTLVNVFVVGLFDSVAGRILAYAKDGLAALETGANYGGFGAGGVDLLEAQLGTGGGSVPYNLLQDGNNPPVGTANGTTTLATATPYLFHGIWDRVTTNDVEVWLDGTQEGTGSSGAAAADNVAAAFILGAHGSYTATLERRLDGLIGEVLVVHGALSAATRQLIEGYLAWKWGLVSTLPGGHPYEDGPPIL